MNLTAMKTTFAFLLTIILILISCTGSNEPGENAPGFPELSGPYLGQTEPSGRRSSFLNRLTAV